MAAALRSLVVLASAAAVLVGPLISASAGGAPLHFDRRYYLPGDTAHGTTTFGKGSVGLHMMDRGPFYAYLVRGHAYIDPPRIPRGAIRLAPIEMTPIGGNQYRASLSFTVPDVRSGGYSIEYCNDPCTVAGVGELWGGWIDVFATHDEARVQMKLDRLEQRLRQIRTNHRSLKRRVAERRLELEEALEGARAVNAELAERVASLEGDLATARARERETPWWAVAGWSAFGLVVIANLAALAVRRRRRLRPTTAPERPPLESTHASQRELEPVP